MYQSGFNMGNIDPKEKIKQHVLEANKTDKEISPSWIIALLFGNVLSWIMFFASYFFRFGSINIAILFLYLSIFVLIFTIISGIMIYHTFHSPSILNNLSFSDNFKIK